MNRRSFFKGLCALALAPLAAAVPIPKPKVVASKYVPRLWPAWTQETHPPLSMQSEYRSVLDWSGKHQLLTVLENPEIVKGLADNGLKIDYEALSRMMQGVAK